MLGPSVLFFGPPFSMAYAIRAFRIGDSKFAAAIAIVVAAMELFFILFMTLLAVFG